MPMNTAGAMLAVALGGAVGAVTRWAVSLGAARVLARSGAAPFPLGTVLVNVAGCFLLAWLVATGARNGIGAWWRLFLGTGLLGALTTFSTFGVDGHGLITQGRSGAAALYLGGTLIGAGLAVVAGWALGRPG